MKKNRLFFMFAALFISAAVLFSCQKDNLLLDDLQLKASSISGNFSLTYPDEICANENFILTFGGTGFTGTRTVQIQQLIDGDWEQVFQQAQAPSGTEATLNYAAGTYNFRWSVSGQNGPNNVEFTIEVVNCGCEEWMEESSFAGSTIVDVKPWFYYYVGGAQTLWGGKTSNVGGVNVVDGDLVIQLTGGWQLQLGEETVKVYGYVDMPTYRPNPGVGQPNEYSEMIYKGTSLTFEDLPIYNYYVIHVDVRKCMD